MSSVVYRFGVFEFEPDTGELRKNGRLIALEPQPARVLALLLARADSIVSRDEIREAVWGPATFVDFDRGLAYCLSQIRAALGDSGQNPRFVQTIPRKGYRFIAPVHSTGSPETEGLVTANLDDSPTRTQAPGMPSRTWWAGAAVLAIGAIGWMTMYGVPFRGKTIIAVSVFDNETGRPDLERRVTGLSDLVVTHLAQLEPDRIAIIGNAAPLRRPRNIRDLKAVVEGVRADYVVLGQLQESESGFRFITHFVRLPDETHLKANLLSFPGGDLSRLETAVLGEFELTVKEHLLN